MKTVWTDYGDTMHSFTKKHQSGLSLIELLLVVFLMAVTMTGVAGILNSWKEDALDHETARHMNRIQAAAETYVELNFFNLLTDTIAPVSSIGEISLADLINQGYLPAGFDTSTPYKQDVRVFIRHATDSAAYGSVIEVVTLSEGTPVADKQLFKAAEYGNTKTGVVSCLNLSTGECNNTTIRGTSGAWSLNLADFLAPNTTYSGVPTEAGGYMAAYGRVANKEILADKYLFRVDDPLFPEANVMETNLDMNAHYITNANITVADSMNISGDATFDNTGVGGITSPYILSVRDNFSASNMAVNFNGDQTKGNLLVKGDDGVGDDFIVTDTLDIQLDNVSGTGTLNSGSLTTENIAIRNKARFQNLDMLGGDLQTEGNLYAKFMNFGDTLNADRLQLGEANSGFDDIWTVQLVARTIDTDTMNFVGNMDIDNTLTAQSLAARRGIIGTENATITNIYSCSAGCP